MVDFEFGFEVEFEFALNVECCVLSATCRLGRPMCCALCVYIRKKARQSIFFNTSECVTLGRVLRCALCAFARRHGSRIACCYCSTAMTNLLPLRWWGAPAMELSPSRTAFYMGGS